MGGTKMSELIEIDIGSFNEKMESLKTSVEQINQVISKSETLDKTNIEPFVENLSLMIESLELLERYKGMVASEDVPFIKKKVSDLVAQDEELSLKTIDSHSGPQAIRV